MGCCKTNSRRYLKLLNVLISVLGLATLGAGIYAVITYKEALEAVNELAPYGGIVAGVVLLLLGVMGWYGANKQKKVVLVVYWVLLTLMTLVVLATGAGVLVFSGQLDDVGTGQAQADDASKTVNDFIVAVYNDCCVEEFGAAPPVQCTSANEVGDGCYFDQGDFDAVEIGESFCNVLEQAEVTLSVGGSSVSGPVVGDPSESACASPLFFTQALSQFLEDNLAPIGGAFIGLAVVLLLADIATCVLICTNRVDYDKAYREKKQQQQQAGAVTGTQASNVRYA